MLPQLPSFYGKGNMDFRGPPGEPGEPGPRGEPGKDGLDGTNHDPAELRRLNDDVALLSARVTDESTARIEDGVAFAGRLQTIEASYVDQAEVERTVNARVSEETAARTSAIEAVSDKVTQIEATLETGGAVDTAARAAIEEERQARATADEAEASARDALEASLRTDTAREITAAVTTEREARTTAAAAEASRVDQLLATYAKPGDIDTKVSAALTDERKARADAIGAEASRVDGLLATYAKPGDIDAKVSAAVQSEAKARTDAAAAEATRVDQLLATYAKPGDISAAISAEQRARADAVKAEADRVDSLLASYAKPGDIDTKVSAAITTEQKARADAITAEASARRVLEATARAGGNLVPNTAFATLNGWNLSYNAYNGSFLVQNGAGRNYQIGGTENNLCIRRPNDIAGLGAEVLSSPFAVKPAGWVQYYGLVASHRARGWVSLFFYDSADAYIGYAGEGDATVINQGGVSIDAHEIVGRKAVRVPANAVSARFVFRQYDVQGGDGYSWLHRPMCVEVEEGAASWVPYSPGNDRPVTAGVFARIADEATTAANATAAEGRRVEGLLVNYATPGTVDAKISAAIQTEQQARTSAIGAEGRRVEGLLVNYATNAALAGYATPASVSAAVKSESDARASSEGAIGRRIDGVEATANGASAFAGTQASVNADLYGRSSARFSINANNGSGRASLSVVADGYNGVDIEGDLRVSGNAIIGGSIQTGAMANGAVTNGTAATFPNTTVYSGQSTETATASITAAGSGKVRVDVGCIPTYVGFNGQYTNGLDFVLYRIRGTETVEVLRWQAIYGQININWCLDEPGAGVTRYSLRAIERGGGGNPYWTLNNNRISVMEFKK